jgi:ParB family chromosome partitioning protein
MKKVLASSVVDVPLDDIIVSKANTREFYDQQKLDDLQNNIGNIGQIYPVVLRRLEEPSEKFELLIGTRRLKVAYRRKALTIPAFITDDISDEEVMFLALAENLHRSDLTPFEEAKAFLNICKEFSLEPKEVAKRIGKPESFVRGRLKILSLPEEVQRMICNEDGVTFSHVDILASLKKPQDQIRYAKVVAKQKLSQGDLVTLLREDVQNCPRRDGSPGLFTPQATALRVKRFNTFLIRRVRPRIALGGEETREIRIALRQMRTTINELLGRSEIVQKTSS